jgi:cell division transport system ATP-binding protein
MEMESIIALEGVYVIQEDLSQVLAEVDFTVNKGDFVYLIGKTGSGKSSLLKVLYADLPLHDGSGMVVNYQLNGIKKLEIPYLRRKIGMIFQDFKLLTDRSVTENLNFVLEATDWKDKNKRLIRVNEVLFQVGLSHKAKKMPHQLSGGEQQRLAIARSLLNKPPLILADEPTGNLDPRVADDILDLLHQINSNGTAVVMATHDYRLINKYPGIVYKLENGIIDRTNLVF